MTAGEAVSLVMKADLLAKRPETYWLDMGEPVAIGPLVARLQDLELAAGHPRVPVRVVGLGPGESATKNGDPGLRMCPRRIAASGWPASGPTTPRRCEVVGTCADW
ncbi:MAG: polysaccharide biosynthesis protein [Vicinamibacterales bacterium]